MEQKTGDWLYNGLDDNGIIRRTWDIIWDIRSEFFLEKLTLSLNLNLFFV